MRRLCCAALVLSFAAASAASEPDLGWSDSLERAFTSDGTVTFDLSAGEYRIRGGESDRIRVAWFTRDAEDLDAVQVSADVRGREATVRTSGPRNHFRVDIELPAHTDLDLRMTAGDLTIAGIEGNKDVRLRAGNLTIEVADAAQYGTVSASVTAGDLSASPFGVSKGGLFRSFTHAGRGRYDLKARLWAGDLRLKAAKED